MKKLTSIIASNIIESDASQLNGFAILKPGFLDHEDDFLDILKRNGWQIVQKRRMRMSLPVAKKLYSMHSKKEFYPALCDYMASGDCLCCSCHKDSDDPIKDMNNIKDKVRSYWGKDDMRNAMHSSDSLDNVNRESALIFNNLDVVNESLDDLVAADDIPVVDIASILRSLYADEINAFYQYWIVADFLRGMERPDVERTYKEYAMDELTDHAQKLLKRMDELNISPDGLTDLYATNYIAKAKYMIPDDSFDTYMSLTRNIIAEQNAIDHYKEAVRLTEGIDPVSNQLFKDILKDEEEHRNGLQTFCDDINSILAQTN